MPAFLLEVGTEELPASFLSDALTQWRSRIPQALSAQSLNSEAVEVYGTPRRLAVLIQGLPSQQPDREEDVKGPPAQTAFQDGKPKPAAVGFAKKQGVDVSALEIRTTDKGDFIFVRKVIPGRPVAEILTELVREWIWGLEGKRLMRWGDGDARFSRPIRWLVALLDDAVLPIELVNGSETIKSDRLSHGHRVLYPKTVTIPQATDYLTALRSAYVVVNPDERATTIQQQIQESVQEVDGYAEIYPGLLAEVTNLVEWPTAVVGKFESEFLNLPTEVITTVMVSHQRYFPVFTAANTKELLPYFVTISNGDPAKSDIIAVGNARVIRARLADGQFFYKADLAKPLDSFLPQLAKVTFQEDLGSLLDKVGRIEKNTELIIAQLKVHLNSHDFLDLLATAPRAAKLCKADLVSQMVYEFPELQGVMGQKYAAASGESELVATAILEHYLPKGADDVLPQTLGGQVVGLADRLDTLVSIFSLGMIPTGSSDPFALRRAANAVVNVTWSANLRVNLQQLLEQIAGDNTQLLLALQDFFLQRVRTLLQEEHRIDYDLVNVKEKR